MEYIARGLTVQGKDGGVLYDALRSEREAQEIADGLNSYIEYYGKEPEDWYTLKEYIERNTPNAECLL